MREEQFNERSKRIPKKDIALSTTERSGKKEKRVVGICANLMLVLVLL